MCKRYRVLICFKILLLVLLGCSQSTLAKIKLSSTQLEYFKSMPDEEKLALAKELGLELPKQDKVDKDSLDSSIKPRKPFDTKKARTDQDPKASTKLSSKDNSDNDNDSINEDKVQEVSDEDSQADTEEETQLVELDEELKPFGYALFAGDPVSFLSNSHALVPEDYILGPGDTLAIQLYGKENKTLDLTIDREGQINFPELGPISAAGLKFSDFKKQLTHQIQQQIIGASTNISIGKLRSIQVFILGEAYKPGVYTVSALTNITNALYHSGGFNENASLRTIQLKRKGQLVTELDLYDLLLKGDNSKDARLQPGDVIFIPTVGSTVTVEGAVKRPAIYELKSEKRLKEVLQLAGGLKADAYKLGVSIERFGDDGQRTAMEANLNRKQNPAIINGDQVMVPSALERYENIVSVGGHVFRPAKFSWHQGLRVSQVIRSLAELKPHADLKFALINREVNPTGELEVLHLNLEVALSNPGSRYDVKLRPRDELLVFSRDEDREELLSSLVKRLEEQSNYLEPAKLVAINGHVRFPGTYPLYKNMTLEGAITAAYDLKEDADIRYVLVKRKVRNQGRLAMSSYDLSITDPRTVKLTPGDEVLIFGINKPREELLMDTLIELETKATINNPVKIVHIDGHVKFPGSYPLTEPMTVQQLIQAAGGLSENAFRLTGELTRFNIFDGIKREVQHKNLALLEKSDNGLAYQLSAHDTLVIKKIPDWERVEKVEISGEVKFPGTYSIKKGETLLSLLNRVGGITEHAHIQAAVFTREELRELEEKRIMEMSQAAQKDLVLKEIESDNALATSGKKASVDGKKVKEKIALVEQLNNTKAIGRMVIQLDKLLAANSNYDLVLKDGDKLLIPRYRDEVSIIGEVQQTTSHLYQAGLNVDDYLALSGGLTSKADADKVYVVRASGAVLKPHLSDWFAFNDMQIQPGDTIVVPIDSEKISPLSLWTSVTQIIYNSAVAVAAIAAL